MNFTSPTKRYFLVQTRLHLMALLALVIGNHPVYGENAAARSTREIGSNSLEAHRRFWDAFRHYEMTKRKSSADEFQKARDGLQSLYDKEDGAYIEKRVNSLEAAIGEYQENLQKTTTGPSRPFVLLNLAQASLELSALQSEQAHSANALKSKNLAIDSLKAIIDSHANFIHTPEALYLLANTLEAVGRSGDALPIWKNLASTNRDSFGMHGNLVLGDRQFENASPDSAIKYYEQAAQILKALNRKDQPMDELRVFYRIAWANFKAGRPNATLKAIRRAVSPDVISQAVAQRSKIVQDLADLAAYSLFALDQTKVTSEFMKSRDFLAIAPKASLTIMGQYLTTNIPNKASDVGEIAADQFALAPEFPDILNLKIRADEMSGRQSSRLTDLEKLSMLLPAQSLWREKNKKDSGLLRHMEELARNANEVAATEYYQQGLNSGNPKTFSLAATYFQNLLDDAPPEDKALRLRLNIANCKYFAGRLFEAEKSYRELISSFKSPEDVLVTAYYQRALTLEKIWRNEFESSIQKNIEPTKNQSILAALGSLESAVEDHATRFPSQSRSIDLLIVAAGANRDQGQFAAAGNFWQRVLLSNPSSGQRAIAVRGLIFNKIRGGRPSEIIESASNFLKFEPADSLNAGLRQELLGVLSTATKDESSQLARRGLTDEAGTILLQVVSEFSDLPDREKLWRDGAYFLAISGNWPRAQASSESFLRQNFKAYTGDMKYLLARAHEYQLRFDQAVKAYLDLAENYPSHARAKAAMDRAERLALADNNFALAGRAAEESSRHQVGADRFRKLDEAILYYSKGNLLAKAKKVAQARLRFSKTTSDKLQSELSLAKIRYDAGEIQTALDDLDTLAKQIERAKPQLREDYKNLAAEANMILGEYALSQFNKTTFQERGGNIPTKMDKKGKFFKEMTSRFDTVAALDLPNMSPKARYLAAQAASNFADEISSLPQRAGEPTSLRNQTRYNQDISRLRDMALKYHGNNILAKQRAPQALKGSPWIGRSALALSTSAGQAERTGAIPVADQLSTASSNDMPQQWSH